jgi:NADH-quinone oxidoreductase subunit M
VFSLLSLLLTAGYYLWAMQKTLFGKLTDKIDLEHCHDIAKNEVLVLAVLCGLIALFGIMPSVAMDFITPFTAGIQLI